jgi:hypothetical protein
MVVTLNRETLESSLIEMTVSYRPVRNLATHGVRVCHDGGWSVDPATDDYWDHRPKDSLQWRQY